MSVINDLGAFGTIIPFHNMLEELGTVFEGRNVRAEISECGARRSFLVVLSKMHHDGLHFLSANQRLLKILRSTYKDYSEIIREARRIEMFLISNMI